MKKNRKLQFVLIFAALAILLSGCGGDGFLPSSWAGLTPNEDGSRLYVAHNQGIYAIDPTSAIIQMTYPATAVRGATYYAPPVVTADGQLLAAAYNNTLYSYDLATGAELWRFNGSRSRFLASPLVLDDVIYAPNADGHLYALNLNGQLLAEFETGEGLWATPATDGRAIYITSMDGRVYSLAPRTLRENWNVDTGAALVATPVLDDEGLLYVGNFNSQLLGINTRNGVIEWRVDLGNWVWGPPTLADGVLYVGDLGGRFYAFEPGVSAPLWNVPLEGQLVGAPLVTEDTLYIGTGDGYFYAISLDGTIRWTRQAEEDAKLLGSPMLVGDFILVSKVEGDNVLVAYDRNGVVQWEFKPGN